MVARVLKSTILIVIVGFGLCLPAQAEDLNVLMMESTFEIVGPGQQIGKVSFGSGFILAKPVPWRPRLGFNVLITATHVLDAISGDRAEIILRRSDPTTKMVTTFSYSIKIRSDGINLYAKNPKADVSAMYVALPGDMGLSFLPIDALAQDNSIKRIDLHPGDEVFALGFPLAVNLDGFPVLRTGVIASYPLTPQSRVKLYYIAFHVFPGNSGGPVYYSYVNRNYGGQVHLGSMDQAVLGIVSRAVSSALPEFKELPLDLSVVVPAEYIRETINLLPDRPE